MDFDLESWWERNGKGFKNADIYTSECEVYDFCAGLVGDVLNYCERQPAAPATCEIPQAEEDDGAYEVLQRYTQND